MIQIVDTPLRMLRNTSRLPVYQYIMYPNLFYVSSFFTRIFLLLQ